VYEIGVIFEDLRIEVDVSVRGVRGERCKG
jgi:hypothetical protein